MNDPLHYLILPVAFYIPLHACPRLNAIRNEFSSLAAKQKADAMAAHIRMADTSQVAIRMLSRHKTGERREIFFLACYF